MTDKEYADWFRKMASNYNISPGAQEAYRRAAIALDPPVLSKSEADELSDVSAEYRNRNGDLLWVEDPYPYHCKFGVGQTVYRGKLQYKVVSNHFKGVPNNGHVVYVLKEAN